jgi:RNA ligase
MTFPKAPSPFPVIHNRRDLEMFVSHKEEIRFLPQSNGTSVCCYMVSGPDTFDDMFAREARGITFDADGNVIGRPLHKFFNVNEKEHTLAHKLTDSIVTRLMDKRDGSMIHTVWLDGEVYFKSKKSFESDVAKAAMKWLHEDRNSMTLAFCRWVASNKMTAIFEWTSPAARIVLSYPDDDLQLLHVRDNTTGEYLDMIELRAIAEQAYGVQIVEPQKVLSFEQLLKLAETEEGIEGWVAQFENGDMVKVKTKWYMDRHHAMTFLRVRDIAKMVIAESLDDLKAKLHGDGIDITPILDIEHRVMSDLYYISDAIWSLYQELKDLTRKEAAEKFRTHEHFKQAMRIYTVNGNARPEPIEYFEKHLLSKYELDHVQLVDSVAEEE